MYNQVGTWNILAVMHHIQKKVPQYFYYKMLTDFQNYFTDRLGSSLLK